jgi:hypothetical protein
LAVLEYDQVMSWLPEIWALKVAWRGAFLPPAAAAEAGTSAATTSAASAIRIDLGVISVPFGWRLDRVRIRQPRPGYIERHP